LATAPITFNIIALHSLSLDVAELEHFARSRDIPDLDSKFAEIRQTLDLFLTGNIEQILDAPTRQTKFAQVNLGRLAKIMNKCTLLFNLYFADHISHIVLSSFQICRAGILCSTTAVVAEAERPFSAQCDASVAVDAMSMCWWIGFFFFFFYNHVVFIKKTEHRVQNVGTHTERLRKKPRKKGSGKMGEIARFVRDIHTTK
jgi:hypothetical protein